MEKTNFFGQPDSGILFTSRRKCGPIDFEKMGKALHFKNKV